MRNKDCERDTKRACFPQIKLNGHRLVTITITLLLHAVSWGPHKSILNGKRPWCLSHWLRICQLIKLCFWDWSLRFSPNHQKIMTYIPLSTCLLSPSSTLFNAACGNGGGLSICLSLSRVWALLVTARKQNLSLQFPQSSEVIINDYLYH